MGNCGATAESWDMPEPDLAYLSQRKLHLRNNGVTQTLESEFERTVRERTASIERRNSWKTQGRGAMFLGGAGLAQQQAAARQIPVLITGLTRAPGGGLLYSMETDSISGNFLRDAEGVETRLFHTADFRIRHASLHTDGATLTATRSTSSHSGYPEKGGASFFKARAWVATRRAT